ncbi:hypothetical protein CsSME_00030443 [Camellia sinensis var. sinensis]
MKLSSIAMLLVLVSTLLFSIPYATSDLATDAFVQCLKKQVGKSIKPISEAIYIPENSKFSNIFYAYFRNKRLNTTKTRYPVAIVAAIHESHVQAAVICTKNHNYHLRIRSGGHDYEGLSYISNEPFVLLDMSDFRSINIDVATETAWVQSGASLGELYLNISQKSKTHAFPGGVCPSVGVGGHFIGAGYGNLMRKYGLSVDNIIDAQLVDVNGKILNRKSMGEDHFWAIRGGGASFGVILSWKIKLVSVPEIVTFFLVKKLIKQGATRSITDLVYRWQQVADTLPEDIFIRLEMSVEKNESIQFQFFGQYLGQSHTLLSIMNQQFPELGLQQKDCIKSSWIETTLYWDNKPKGISLDSLLYRMLNESFPFKVKSDYVITPIPKAVLEELWKQMIKMGMGMIMQWNPYGGRMNQISESETPFPHRSGYKFLIQYWYYTQDDSKVESLRKLYDFLAPHVSQSPREAFLNYRDLDIGTNQNGANSSIFGAKYFKGNFERLVRVKTKVDPDNFFRNEQSIPPLPK